MLSDLDWRQCPVSVELSEEEGVDHGGLAQAGLPHHHQRELEASLHRLREETVNHKHRKSSTDFKSSLSAAVLTGALEDSGCGAT